MTVKYFRLFTSEANASDALTSLLNLDYAIDENWVSSALLINDFAYLPSGQEHRLGSEFYLDLREKVLALAAEAQGLQKFDPTASSQAMFTEFDTLMYKNISELIPVTLYEASKPGVWSYITL
ncbi:MAG: hypothetical protein RLZZ330_1121, partial [Actinomycetota bacterium]